MRAGKRNQRGHADAITTQRTLNERFKYNLAVSWILANDRLWPVFPVAGLSDNPYFFGKTGSEHNYQ